MGFSSNPLPIQIAPPDVRLNTAMRVRLTIIGILPHVGNLLLKARHRRLPLNLEFLARTL